jgi:hypothetical protein
MKRDITYTRSHIHVGRGIKTDGSIRASSLHLSTRLSARSKTRHAAQDHQAPTSGTPRRISAKRLVTDYAYVPYKPT